MRTMDISPLVQGILVVMGIALATGQYGTLEHWARSQAIEAMEWKQPLPYFFSGHGAKVGHHSHRPHKEPRKV